MIIKNINQIIDQHNIYAEIIGSEIEFCGKNNNPTIYWFFYIGLNGNVDEFEFQSFDLNKSEDLEIVGDGEFHSKKYGFIAYNQAIRLKLLEFKIPNEEDMITQILWDAKLSLIPFKDWCSKFELPGNNSDRKLYWDCMGVFYKLERIFGLDLLKSILNSIDF